MLGTQDNRSQILNNVAYISHHLHLVGPYAQVHILTWPLSAPPLQRSGIHKVDQVEERFLITPLLCRTVHRLNSKMCIIVSELPI